MEHIFPPTSCYEPDPYIRTTATNGDYDAKAETATAPGADENDDDQDDEHEYVNTETDYNIESEKNHIYGINEKNSKQLLDATNVGIRSIPNTRFKKQQTKV